MLSFEDIQPATKIKGLTPPDIATIISTEPFDSSALKVVYKDSNGNYGDRILYENDLADLALISSDSSWTFDADGNHLRMVAESNRIRLAHHFDPYLAIHTSLVDPLPHQITAVYGAMLTRQPLRFLLADDPGAGKTIMAGLLIKELIIRGDVERCLIVVPGNLVEQWQDELRKKFKREFKILSREMIRDSSTGNPFNENNYLIARLDMLARDDTLKEKLQQAKEWDLVIVDEAHRMSASLSGRNVSYTKRYHLGMELEKRCRHFLLMTATPHNGKMEDFQLFMALLDADRFGNKFENGVEHADTHDIMRRLTKEELLTFEGTPLFPKRHAQTIAYELSPPEKALYDAVTDYVTTQMNRYTTSNTQKRLRVTFALLILQRRLASSTAAIRTSLERRRKKLEAELSEAEKTGRLNDSNSSDNMNFEDMLENPDEYEQEDIDSLVEEITSGESIEELRNEVVTLKRLEQQAEEVVKAGDDTKWQELKKIFQDDLVASKTTGKCNKLIIFTESRDTIAYLVDKIQTLFGKSEAVDCIHGGISREKRHDIISRFMQDTNLVVLVANDAAGEGVNLQRGNLMINYDLPWNPNKLEQRFGRIHRIGQMQTCYLWNLLAINTREGAVYAKLLQKIEEINKAMNGRVFDVLGDLLEGASLQDLLIDAIKNNELEGISHLDTIIGTIDIENIRAIMKKSKLTKDIMSKEEVNDIYKQMQIAEAQRLQPYHIESFFVEAFKHLGGKIKLREQGRYQIDKIPSAINSTQPVGLSGYERVCFDKAHINQQPVAAFITPGHPLLAIINDLIHGKYQALMKQGAVMVDENDADNQLHILFLIEHTIHDGHKTSMGKPQIISQKLQFARLHQDGTVSHGGIAPHLDLRAITAEEKTLVADELNTDWLKGDIEHNIESFAITDLAKKHLAEVKAHRRSEIDKVEREVKQRLETEIRNEDSKAEQAREQERLEPNKYRLVRENAEKRVVDLLGRLENRKQQFEQERTFSASSPSIKGGFLVVPQGLLDNKANPYGSLHEAGGDKKEIEQLAMDAVMAVERDLGNQPEDVSAQKCGYDICSVETITGNCRFIEVKGRHHDADIITVTRNEIITSKNCPENYILAIVLIGNGITYPPHYISKPFLTFEPDGATVSANFKIKDLLEKIEVLV